MFILRETATLINKFFVRNNFITSKLLMVFKNFSTILNNGYRYLFHNSFQLVGGAIDLECSTKLLRSILTQNNRGHASEEYFLPRTSPKIINKLSTIEICNLLNHYSKYNLFLFNDENLN